MATRNAYLQYKDKKHGLRTHHIWIMGYDQGFQLAGGKQQSKLFQHFYSKSYAPGDMIFHGRVAYQRDYNELAEFIRAHHMTIMHSPGANNSTGTKHAFPMMLLEIPSEGLRVNGVITTFQAGAKRFNVAPPYSFTMMVLHNRQSEKIVDEYTVRNTWTGNLVGSAPTNSQGSNNGGKPVAPPPGSINNPPRRPPPRVQ